MAQWIFLLQEYNSLVESMWLEDEVAIGHEFWIDCRNFETKLWGTRRVELGTASRIHETGKDGDPVEFGTFVHNIQANK